MDKDFIAKVKNTLAEHKKKVWRMIILAALLAVISVGVHSIFHVSGIVTGIDNNRVTVANFFRTQTVDLMGSPVNTTNIKLGDKVNIEKNLQGQVLAIRVKTLRHGEHKHEHREL